MRTAVANHSLHCTFLTMKMGSYHGVPAALTVKHRLASSWSSHCTHSETQGCIRTFKASALCPFSTFFSLHLVTPLAYHVSHLQAFLPCLKDSKSFPVPGVKKKCCLPFQCFKDETISPCNRLWGI